MKMLPKVFIHLLLITIIFFNFYHLAAAAKCHPDDEAGLLAFKSGIKSDPSGLLRSWIPGTGCCSAWQGISCTQPNRVTDITLFGDGHLNNSTINLYGTISPALSKLQYLHTIYLYNLRNITGPFPTFLFELPRLRNFFFVNTTLSGKLPENIGTRFSTSKELVAFSFEGNRLSGTIPTSLGLLTHLIEIYLSGNMLTGSIPYSIGNLYNLRSLTLDNNQLTGIIPDFFKGLTNLTIFNASHNKLSGNIPGSITAIFRSSDGANTLDLSWNQLQGMVPKSFANLTHVFRLDLSHNHLCGQLPKTNFSASVFVGNHCLCGFPLPRCKLL